MIKRGVNLPRLKEQNIRSILNVIREHGPVSRRQVGHLLGLSNTTCMELTRDLVSLGLIRETGQGASSGGRKPILLELNRDYSYALGMFLSQDGISCGVYDLQLNKKSFVRHNIDLTDKDIIPVIKECTVETMQKNCLAEETIAGMTIGIGGVVDAEKANIIGSTHFHSRRIIRIHDQLDSIFSFPIYLENYGNLMALAEKRLFYPQRESLVFIQVDSGIGSGIICNNKIIRGTSGYAGEIGHMTIERNGPLCFCGNKGCLEVIGSIPALLQRASFGLLTQKDSLIRKYSDSGKVSIEAINRAFEDQDKLAKKLFEEEADVLYHAVLDIILTYDPEVIVLGGGIVLFGEALLDRIRQSIRNTIFDVNSENRVIAYSQLTDHPGVCGAALYTVESFFANPLPYFVLNATQQVKKDR
jgi:predicted NBD/HSP70 family sugar kinase